MLGVDIFVSKLFCRVGMVVDLPAVWRYTGARGGTQSEAENVEANVSTISSLQFSVHLFSVLFAYFSGQKIGGLKIMSQAECNIKT